VIQGNAFYFGVNTIICHAVWTKDEQAVLLRIPTHFAISEYTQFIACFRQAAGVSVYPFPETQYLCANSVYCLQELHAGADQARV
jgi:uncharacterized membrane protein